VVNSAAFDPSGARAITASADQTARIWDAATGAEIMILSHADGVGSASFSPSGDHVLTTFTGRSARIWNTGGAIDGPALIDYARAATLRTLSTIERSKLFLGEDRSVATSRLEPAASPPRSDARSCDTQPDTSSGPSVGSGIAVRDMSSDAVLNACAPAAAANHGYATAPNDSGIPYREDNGVLENRAEAPRLLDGNACKGDPWSHMRLADLSERVGSSLDSALLHHAIAASLFTDLHVSDGAASETAHRGSLARNMPRPEVIRLWRQFLTWRQTRSACQGQIQ